MKQNVIFFLLMCPERKLAKMLERINADFFEKLKKIIPCKGQLEGEMGSAIGNMYLLTTWVLWAAPGRRPGSCP